MKWWLLALGIIVVGAGASFAESSIGGDAQPPTPDDSGLDSGDIFGGNVSRITTDPATWPFSDADPIGAVCNAVARAEGYNVPGSNPFRLNNPGDISDGASTYGSEAHSGSNVTHFPDAETGWDWLYSKWSNIVSGNSEVYSPDMTWDQLARKWAGNWTAWSANVTTYLRVNRGDRVGDYFGV